MSRPIIGIGCDFENQVKRPCSFTYTTYIRAVEQAGGVPLLIPALGDLTLIPELLERLQGIVLTGSDDIDPAVYGEQKHPKCGTLIPAEKTTPDLELVRRARTARIPILAICGGMQLVNVAAGGTLVQDVPSEFRAPLPHSGGGGPMPRHEIQVAPGSLLAEVFGAGRQNVNSGHHQCVKKLAEGLKQTAAAPDGVPEAFEGTDSKAFLLGVQWHPERIINELANLNLFKALVNTAKKRRI